MIEAYEDEYIRVVLEESDLGLVFHCESKCWNKGVVSKYDMVLEYVLLKWGDVIAPIEDSDVKLQKFASMFGFEATEEFGKYSDDVPRRIWKCQRH